MDEIGTVVVGVDGSSGSRAPLDHALQDAARRGARLRVVAAVPLPDYWSMAYGMGPLPPAEFDADVRNEAQLMVDDVVAAHPDLCTRVPVTVDAVNGSPAEVLLRASQDADLLVLGHRGRGGLSSVLLGSVGLQCVLRAVCAVTIVRPVVARAEPDAVPSGAMAAPAPV